MPAVCHRWWRGDHKRHHGLHFADAIILHQPTLIMAASTSCHQLQLQRFLYLRPTASLK